MNILTTLSAPTPEVAIDSDQRLIERASAAPARGTYTAPTKHQRPTQTGPIAGADLAELQQALLTVITDPRSVDHGLRGMRQQLPIGHVFTDGANLDAAACLGIYHYAYHARLIECLIDDYPCVQAFVGTERFEELARAYIASTPSQHPNLNGYGAGFANWLRKSRRPLTNRRCIAEIAELEWHLVEVLHAEAAPNLDPAALAAIPMEAWADMCLRPSATLRLLETKYPVNTVYQHWREDKPLHLPVARGSAVAIYRQGYRLWRMDLSPLTHSLLKDLINGMPLGTALDRCATAGANIPDLIPRVMEWFQSWVSGGFFAAVSNDS